MNSASRWIRCTCTHTVGKRSYCSFVYVRNFFTNVYLRHMKTFWFYMLIHHLSQRIDKLSRLPDYRLCNHSPLDPSLHNQRCEQNCLPCFVHCPLSTAIWLHVWSKNTNDKRKKYYRPENPTIFFGTSSTCTVQYTRKFVADVFHKAELLYLQNLAFSLKEKTSK